MTQPPAPRAPQRAPRGAVFWLLSSQLIMFTGIAALVCALGLPRRAAAVAPRPTVREREIV